MKASEIDTVIDQIWRLYDVDGNGYLDKVETKKLITDVFNYNGQILTPTEFERILKMIDTNGDGLMDREELKRLLM